MRLVSATLAAIIAIACWVNFFLALNGQSPVPVSISHPLFFITMGYLLFRHIFPRTISSASPEANSALVAEIASSSPIRFSGRYSGRIGWLRATGPLLRVDIHAAGLIMKPILTVPIALRASDITAFTTTSGWFLGTTITHSSPSVRGAISLASSDPKLLQALHEMAPHAQRTSI
jgi:hypothetical protein